MSGGQKQVTTSSNSPWGPAQPALTANITKAQELQAAGTGGQVYSGSTVTPWSAQTTQGMGNMQSMANANMGSNGVQGQYQGIINNGGFTGDQKNSMSYFNNLAGTNPFDVSSNPAYAQYKSAALGDVADQSNASFSGAGRYGSGAHAAGLATGLGRVGNEMDMSQMGRMDNANMQRNQMAQQGMQNIGSAYQGMQAPTQSLMQVGSMNEDMASRTMEDQLRIFNETQNKPWEMLGRANAIVAGNGAMGNSQTQATKSNNNNMLSQILGGGLGLLASR